MTIRARRGPSGCPDEPIGVRACSLRADRVRVISPDHITPGTGVMIPVQTVRGDFEPVRGVVESCIPAHLADADAPHRIQIRFDQRIRPARFAVCWGVVIEADGTLTEIATSPHPIRSGGEPFPKAGCIDPHAERAVNIATILNEISRRAAEGADDAELREITDLLHTLLESDRQTPAA